MTSNSASDTGAVPSGEFAVRVTAIDYHMVRPHPLFDCTHSRVAAAPDGTPLPLSMVPVIRVFGATPRGQRSCVHIHQVFPYCFIPYLEDWDGGDDPGGGGEGVRRLVQQLVGGLDEVLGTSTTTLAASSGCDAPGRKHYVRSSNIVAVHVVCGIPMYGYSPYQRYFVKLVFSHPSKVATAAAALQTGRIMGRPLPLYEAHIPLVLQFMTDYGVGGCDLLRANVERQDASVVAAKGVMFRYPLPPSSGEQERAAETVGPLWLSGGGWNVLLSDERLQRQSRCEVEADLVAPRDLLSNPQTIPRHAFSLPERSGDPPQQHDHAATRQRLVQSLQSIWQQSGEGSQSAVPLGHILLTQPGSQSREPQPPSTEEAAMQEQVQRMVARESAATEAAQTAAAAAAAEADVAEIEAAQRRQSDAAEQVELSTPIEVGPDSAPGSQLSTADDDDDDEGQWSSRNGSPELEGVGAMAVDNQGVDRSSGSYAWTPFIEAVLCSSSQRQSDGGVGSDDASGTTAFSSAEARASLLGGNQGLSQQQPRVEEDVVGTHTSSADNMLEIEALLDWLQSQRDPRRHSSLLGLASTDTAASSDSAFETMGEPEAALELEHDGEDEPRDEHGWTQAEREEEAGIMASQLPPTSSVDYSGDEDDDAAVAGTGDGEEGRLPQLDGTDDRKAESLGDRRRGADIPAGAGGRGQRVSKRQHAAAANGVATAAECEAPTPAGGSSSHNPSSDTGAQRRKRQAPPQRVRSPTARPTDGILRTSSGRPSKNAVASASAAPVSVSAAVSDQQSEVQRHKRHRTSHREPSNERSRRNDRQQHSQSSHSRDRSRRSGSRSTSSASSTHRSSSSQHHERSRDRDRNRSKTSSRRSKTLPLAGGAATARAIGKKQALDVVVTAFSSTARVGRGSTLSAPAVGAVLARPDLQRLQESTIAIEGQEEQTTNERREARVEMDKEERELPGQQELTDEELTNRAVEEELPGQQDQTEDTAAALVEDDEPPLDLFELSADEDIRPSQTHSPVLSPSLSQPVLVVQESTDSSDRNSAELRQHSPDLLHTSQSDAVTYPPNDRHFEAYQASRRAPVHSTLAQHSRAAAGRDDSTTDTPRSDNAAAEVGASEKSASSDESATFDGFCATVEHEDESSLELPQQSSDSAAGERLEVDEQDRVDGSVEDSAGAASSVETDPGFAEAFEQLVSHLPADADDASSQRRRCAFRIELLAQLERGVWVDSIAAAPLGLRPAFQRVQTAFDRATAADVAHSPRRRTQQSSGNSARSEDGGSRRSSGSGAGIFEPPFTFRVTPTDSSGGGSVASSPNPNTERVLVPAMSPPTVEELLSSTPMAYQEPYYSKPADRHRFSFGGQVFHPLSKDVNSLKEFESSLDPASVPLGLAANSEARSGRLVYVVTPAALPPSVEYCEREVRVIERRQGGRQSSGSGGHTSIDNAGREVLAAVSQRETDSQGSSGGSVRSVSQQAARMEEEGAEFGSDDEYRAEQDDFDDDDSGYDEFEDDKLDDENDDNRDFNDGDNSSGRGGGAGRAGGSDDLGVVCSPRYDEGMGFAEMQGASATSGNSMARLLTDGSSRQPQLQPSLPASAATNGDGSTPSTCTPHQQPSPALSSATKSGRRKSVQFGQVREVSLSASSGTSAAGVAAASPDGSPPVHLSSESVQLSTTGDESSGASNNSTGPAMTAHDNFISQLSMATRSTNHESQAAGGFQQHVVSSLHGVQHFVIMSLEVHVQTRAQMLPDPHVDRVTAICYCVRHETQQHEQGTSYTDPVGCLVISPAEEEQERWWWPKPGWEMEIVPDEVALLHALVACIQRWDPDFILGYELENGSLGYVVQRAQAMQRDGTVLDPSLLPDLEGALSRLSDLALDEQQQFFQRKPGGGGEAGQPQQQQPRTENQQRAQQYMVNAGSALRIIGRHCLNLWRILRGEIKLNAYAAEHVALHVLSRHLPQVQHNELTSWFSEPRLRGRALSYCMLRVRLNLQLTDKLDLIGRTAELARVFGIDFYSVLTRGSQFRVESIMLRLCHRHEPPFLASSPSKHQVAAQRALEVIPLVMEPYSRMYVNPVLVLDFRSLYPSVIIAYNLCYSTCLGQLLKGGAGGGAGQQDGAQGGTADGTGTTAKRLGAFDDYQLPAGVLGTLQETLTLSPNEVMFTKPSVRKGILPRMLTEILEARIQVKKDLKAAEQAGDGVLRRILNAKQFALKLVANVTYGYTSASFSGRMPCVDLADAIVGFGRETLERCIRQIESLDNGAHPNWAGAKVQYGDTDSVFVELPGRTREAAFEIGAEIVQAVNRVNPRPVELELEKVYHPCILLTKKRYVGYSWTSPKATEPEFDAKGIETVRRDSCPLVAKMVEKCLRILFETKDLSRVKRYCQRQWARLHLERISMADLIFRKEVRLGTYRDGGPAAALVAAKAMALDRMAAPRHGERVPYVVVFGEPGAPLRACCFPPSAVLAHGSPLRLNYLYYIKRQILPSLARILNLVGADPSQWYESMPRQYHSPLTSLRGQHTAVGGGVLHGQPRNRNRTLDSYYQSRGCVLCFELHRPRGGGGANMHEWYCQSCGSDPQRLLFLTQSRVTVLQKQQAHLRQICHSCCAAASLGPQVAGGRSVGEQCISLDCAVMYERVKLVQHLESLDIVAKDEAKSAAKAAKAAAKAASRLNQGRNTFEW